MGIYQDALATVHAWVPGDERGSDLRQRFLDLLEAQPGAVRADHPGAHLTASALVVAAELDRVLLCLHGRIGSWMQLGGHLEPADGTVVDAAAREASEESGISGLIADPRPIDLDVHPVRCRHGASLHYDIRFAVLAPAGAVPTISAESRQLDWFAPDALPTPLASATDRLVAPAIAAASRLAIRGR